jgi:putative addiction module component (TIGR02574 family)
MYRPPPLNLFAAEVTSQPEGERIDDDTLVQARDRAVRASQALGNRRAILALMTKTELQSEALQLPVEDRLDLAEALWDSLEREPMQLELPAWQREILEERLAADDAAPEAASPWEVVKQRILANL